MVGFSPVSVVIPTLNEERYVGRCLDALLAQIDAEQVIVVDGGSSDRTVEIALRRVRTLSTGSGRAVQMNAGARLSAGEVLLFLHADCVPGPGVIQQLTDAMTHPRMGGAIGGWFRHAPGEPDAVWPMRVICQFSNWRARCCRLPFGDQGIFVRREVFEHVGGYREDGCPEDLVLVRRLRRVGRLIELPGPIYASSRRFLETGWVRQTLRNWRRQWQYWVGQGKTL